MFGRKKKPKSYLKCPFCGRNPLLEESFSDEPKPIFQQKCPNECLRTGWRPRPEYAFKAWVQLVAGYYDAESAIRKFCEQRNEHDDC